MYHELWMASIILMILGTGALVASALFGRRARRKRPYQKCAEARVVEIVGVPREGNHLPRTGFQNRLAAVLEFYADGRPVKVTDPSDRYPCPYRLNESVPICYNPADPQQFQIIRKNRYDYLAPAANAIGMLLLVAGVVLFLVYATRAAR